MKINLLLSSSLTKASKLLDDTRSEASSLMQAPEGLSNEKASQWFDKQNAATSYFICNFFKDYFAGEEKSSKKRMEVLGLLEKGEKLNPGDKQIIYTGDLVSVQMSVKQPAKSIKADEVLARLTAVEGWDAQKAAAFVEAVTKTNAPAKTLEVIPNGG